MTAPPIPTDQALLNRPGHRRADHGAPALTCWSTRAGGLQSPAFLRCVRLMLIQWSDLEGVEGIAAVVEVAAETKMSGTSGHRLRTRSIGSSPGSEPLPTSRDDPCG